MKEHTYHRFDRPLEVTQRLKEFTMKLAGQLRQDEESRFQWKKSKTFFKSRRYCEEWRDTSFPWPGASDIVMPLIDKKFDEMKPHYLSMIFGVNPPVTVKSLIKDNARKSRNVEIMFDWFINANGSPDFMREMFLFSDNLLSGRGIVKPYWRYETRTAPEHITSSRLPTDLLQLVVADTEEQADSLHLLTGQPVLSKREFRVNEGKIGQRLASVFQLDPTDRKEKAELTRLLAWFRGGAKGSLRIEKRDILVDAPAVMSCHPVDLIVPPTTKSLQSSERIGQKMSMSERLIRQTARDEGWIKSATKELLDRIQSYLVQDGESLHSGSAADNVSEEYWEEELDRGGVRAQVYEDEIAFTRAYCYYDYNNDGIDEKVVILYPTGMPDLIMKAYALQTASGRWPFEEAQFELNEPFYHSERGIGEKLDDLDREITQTHRSLINNRLISAAPTFKYRRKARINLRGHHWIPGEGIPVDSMDDLDVLNIPDRGLEQYQEDQYLRVWAEDYLGGVDHGLNGQNSLTEARTATEIQEVKARARMALSMRGMLYTDCLSHVFDSMHDLMVEYGPRSLWVNVTGEEPIRLNREDIQGNFSFQLTATIGDNDPIVASQQKLMRIQMVAQILEKGLMGDKFEIDMGEMVMDWLETEDARLVRRVVRERSPEELQAIQARRQRAQEIQDKMFNNEEMNEEERLEALKMFSKQAPFKNLQKVS